MLAKGLKDSQFTQKRSKRLEVNKYFSGLKNNIILGVNCKYNSSLKEHKDQQINSKTDVAARA